MGIVMRLVLSVGVLSAVLVGLGLGPGMERMAAARGEGKLGRAECTKLALEKKALDKSDVRKYLAMAPQRVAAEFGKPLVERVRHYIALSEKVLFQCPRYVLNANTASLGKGSKIIPPLPVKGPLRARVRRLRRPLVPLPVKRQSGRLNIPTSQA